MNCEDMKLELGAYALGALDPAERAAVDEHLLDCPACAAELSELTEVVDWIGPTSLADVRAIEPTAQLFSLHDRRRRFQLLAAAAAVVAVAGVTVGVLTSGGSQAKPTFAATAGGIHMSVAAEDQAGGSVLHVRVAGLPENERCSLVAISQAGVQEPAGQWTASYAGAATVIETTSLPVSQLARLQLDGDDGHVLVSVPVTA